MYIFASFFFTVKILFRRKKISHGFSRILCSWLTSFHPFVMFVRQNSSPHSVGYTTGSDFKVTGWLLGDLVGLAQDPEQAREPATQNQSQERNPGAW